MVDGRHAKSNVGVKANQRRTHLSTPVTIYALSDPRKPELIRYIGKTKERLNRRLCGHISKAETERTLRGNWVKSLIRCGVSPIIWPLEICTNSNWIEREMFWIRLFKPLGLKNGTDGGEGGNGNKGWKWKPEALARISAIRKGKKLSPENAAMRRIQLRDKALPLAMMPEVRERAAAKLRGRKMSDEAKEKMRASILSSYASGSRKGRVWTEDQKLSCSMKQLEISKPNLKARIPVVCVETGRIFESLAAAGCFTGFGHAKISTAIAHGRTSGGFHWRKI